MKKFAAISVVLFALMGCESMAPKADSIEGGDQGTAKIWIFCFLAKCEHPDWSWANTGLPVETNEEMEQIE